MFNPDLQFDEEKVMYEFNTDLLPTLEKVGKRIGEEAMQGSKEAEDLIRRYHVFLCWRDPENLKLLRMEMRRYFKHKETLQ